MGCKPSKTSQVATENIVPSKSLQKKESDASVKAELEAEANPMPHCEDEEKEDHVIENVEVKEVHLSDTDEEEGKFVATDSPDSYFSSRKDEVMEGVIASIEYLSEVEESKVEGIEMKKDDPMEEDGEAKKGEEEEGEGETSSNDSADLKETIMVEEKECEATATEIKNVKEEKEEEEAEAAA